MTLHQDHNAIIISTNTCNIKHHMSHDMSQMLQFTLNLLLTKYVTPFLEMVLHQDHNVIVISTIMHITSNITCHMTCHKYYNLQEINFWHLFGNGITPGPQLNCIEHHYACNINHHMSPDVTNFTILKKSNVCHLLEITLHQNHNITSIWDP